MKPNSAALHAGMLDEIRRSMRERNRPPTVRELGDVVYLSPAGVAYQLGQMRRRGLIEIVKGGIRLVGERCTCCQGTGVLIAGPTVAASVACSHPEASGTVPGDQTCDRTAAVVGAHVRPEGLGGTDRGSAQATGGAE